MDSLQGGSDDGAGGIGTVLYVVRIFRIFRILRVFRLVRFLKGLNVIFMALLSSIPRLANVFVLLMLMLVLYSILGVQLFAKVKYSGTLDDHGNFRNFFWAFVTLFRSITGESWNEIMHDLTKDEKDHLAVGSWCSPPDLFDESGMFNVLKDKCLIDHPNSCGDRFFHEGIFFFVSYTFVITFIIMNVVIAVILEGYEEGTSDDKHEQEVVEDAIRVWKKYDPNCTLFLTLPVTIKFIQEVLTHRSKTSGINLLEEGFFGPAAEHIGKSASLSAIPMQYTKTLEDLEMNEHGEINVLHAVKLVLRLVMAKNDHDLLREISESESVLRQKDPKALQKLNKHQDRHIARSGVKPGFDLRAQVAASKIQQLFHERRDRKRKRAEMEQKRSESKRRLEQERELQLACAASSSDPASTEAKPVVAASSKDQPSSDADLSPPLNAEELPGSQPHDITMAAVSGREAEDEQLVQEHLVPRSGAAIDGLDEPGSQLRNCGQRDLARSAAEPVESVDPISDSRNAKAKDFSSSSTDKEEALLRSASNEADDAPQAIMVPPVAG
jgi:hypothetical protein